MRKALYVPLCMGLTTSTEGRSGFAAKYLHVVAKTLRVMKLTAFILMGCCLQVSASGLSQEVTLKADDLPLKTVLMFVETQTGLLVSYKANQISDAKNVTVNVTKMPLIDFLQLVLKGRPLEYVIESNTIFIRKKKDLPPAELSIRSILNAPPVTGIVRGPDGQPLAGVNIVIKGTTRGTVSQADGTFSIEAKKGEVLIISSIGYADKQTIIGANPSLGIVQLNLSESKLDEVQIIAYGQTNKRLNTGNVTTVSAVEIQKQPVNNPLYALQGRVPGLQVIPTTGLAGGAVNLQVRGKNSLQMRSDPLVVVDGLPIITNIPGLTTNSSYLSMLSSLNFLNSSDIQSISILKDADATSIYGSRGANGVILITTKKGSIGRFKVDINLQSGFAEVAKKMKLLNTEQYLQMRKEAYLNSGTDISGPDYPQSRADLRQWDQTRYTDWQKELIGGKALYNDFHASVSGGTPAIQYIVGANYHKETTVFQGDNSDQKTGGHFSLTGISPDKKLKTVISASYMSDKNTLPFVDFTNAALTLPPNAPSLYKADGQLNWDPLPNGAKSWNNPYSELFKTYSATINNLTFSGNVEYQILSSLKLSTSVGFNDLSGDAFIKTFPFGGRPPESEATTFGSAGFTSTSSKSLSIEPQLHYDRSIGKSRIGVLIGGSIQNNKLKTQRILASGAPSEALLEDMASATDYSLNNSSSQYRYAAIFSRLSYNWSNKYLVNINGRRDGSSRFGPGKRFGNFASVGTAWIFSEESFIKDKISFMSFGKIRFSYGTSGNDGIGDYQYFERYEAISVTDPYQGAVGYGTLGLFNSDYAWETTKKMEFGIETGFFRDRMLINAAYFRNRSDNQLIGAPYPSMAGPGSATINLPALVQNNGFELTLDVVVLKRNHSSWTSSVNFTSNRNKLISFEDILNSGFYQSVIGRPFFGEDNAYKSVGVDPLTGKYQFTTADGQLTYDPLDLDRADFGKYLRIYTQPKYYGGLSNSLSYKGISLDVFLQFAKQTALSHVNGYIKTAGRVSNLPVEFVNRWQKPGDVAPIQKIYYNVPNDYGIAANARMASDGAYTDASFVRLKNLALSYNLPKKLLTKISLQDVAISVNGQNIWTGAKYRGLDPETQSISSLPPLRVITFGLKASF